MATMDNKNEENPGKRSLEEAEEEEVNIGPSLDDAVKPKKQKVLEYEKMYLANLPSTNRYEKSYMHRDMVTHLAVSKTDFIVTASCDGHVKFWKKQAVGIEFVKHFRAHLGAITCMCVSCDGNLMCTISGDLTLKVFDIINFDMINIIKLGFKPGVSEWMFSAGSRLATVAVSYAEKGVINIYDGKGSGEVIHTIENLHKQTVICMIYNPVFKVMLSADKQGMIEYWSGQENDFKFPKGIVNFDFKTDTDLYDLAMSKTYALTLAISPNGKLFACCTSDRRVRVFHFLTGKKSRVFNEALSTFVELQQSKSQLADMEFGRRIAVERELEKSPSFQLNNCKFDETGYFLLYPTMLGIKVINLHTNRCCKIIGKPENIRILNIAMFQGSINSKTAALTADMKASDNPALQEQSNDPTLFCTAYKKNRFYMFSRRDPDDSQGSKVERDIFNERPSKEEVLAATQINTEKKVSENAVIHTTLGDIQIKLFAKECPKTVENFCVHSRDGYYNGHIFHRVIKGFMIQTGDPLGIGTGGESIWGSEFEDEFHPSLRHDRPYTLSMANAGPNTNGSQFFITVVPTPWLDNKHTVFGRITSGMEVAHNISLAKIHPKTDKPYDDVSIVNVAIK